MNLVEVYFRFKSGFSASLPHESVAMVTYAETLSGLEIKATKSRISSY